MLSCWCRITVIAEELVAERVKDFLFAPDICVNVGIFKIFYKFKCAATILGAGFV